MSFELEIFKGTALSLKNTPNHKLILNLRLWGFESKTCVQEFTAHRPKFNEAVHQASFHPNKGIFFNRPRKSFKVDFRRENPME